MTTSLDERLKEAIEKIQKRGYTEQDIYFIEETLTEAKAELARLSKPIDDDTKLPLSELLQALKVKAVEKVFAQATYEQLREVENKIVELFARLYFELSATRGEIERLSRPLDDAELERKYQSFMNLLIMMEIEDDCDLSDSKQTLTALHSRIATLEGERKKLRIWCDACEGSGHTGAHPHELCSRCSGHGYTKEQPK